MQTQHNFLLATLWISRIVYNLYCLIAIGRIQYPSCFAHTAAAAFTCCNYLYYPQYIITYISTKSIG